MRSLVASSRREDSGEADRGRLVDGKQQRDARLDGLLHGFACRFDGLPRAAVTDAQKTLHLVLVLVVLVVITLRQTLNGASLDLLERARANVEQLRCASEFGRESDGVLNDAG